MNISTPAQEMLVSCHSAHTCRAVACDSQSPGASPAQPEWASDSLLFTHTRTHHRLHRHTSQPPRTCHTHTRAKHVFHTGAPHTPTHRHKQCTQHPQRLAAWQPGSLAAERQKNEKEQGLAEGFVCQRQAQAVAARWKSEWSPDMAKQVWAGKVGGS